MSKAPPEDVRDFGWCGDFCPTIFLVVLCRFHFLSLPRNRHRDTTTKNPSTLLYFVGPISLINADFPGYQLNGSGRNRTPLPLGAWCTARRATNRSADPKTTGRICTFVSPSLIDFRRKGMLCTFMIQATVVLAWRQLKEKTYNLRESDWRFLRRRIIRWNALLFSGLFLIYPAGAVFQGETARQCDCFFPKSPEPRRSSVPSNRRGVSIGAPIGLARRRHTVAIPDGFRIPHNH